MFEPIYLALYVLIGLCAGFLGGLLGIGGGVIVVPALIFLFESLNLFPASLYPENTLLLVALGTSMASIVFTAGSAAFAQYRRDNIHWEIVRKWGPFLVIGSFAASYVAKHLPAGFIKLFIAMFILFVAFVMLSRWSPNPQRKTPKQFVSAILASIAGLVSGMAGIGGGNVIVPTLVYFNTTIGRATAVASTLGFTISTFGTAGYIMSGLERDSPSAFGFVYLPAILPLAIACTIAAPLGVRLAHRMSSQSLRTTFGCLALIVSARMFYSAF